MRCTQHWINVSNGEHKDRLTMYRKQDQRLSIGVADFTVSAVREIYVAHEINWFYCNDWLLKKCSSHKQASKEIIKCFRSWTLYRLNSKREHDRDDLVLCSLNCDWARAEKNYFEYYEQQQASMHKKPRVKFTSSDQTVEEDKQANLLFEKFKKNIVGCPSLVFNRMQGASVTQIT